MKNIVVTGANGFVGRSLVTKLATMGCHIYAIVREKSIVEYYSSFSNVSLVYCDIDNYDNLHTLIANPIDVFYHLAWDGTSGEKRENYALQINNVKGTCDAVLAASRLNCKKFIYAGSIVEYELESNMVNLAWTPNKSQIYNITKKTADYLARTLCVNNGIQYVCALISNIYGPGEKSARLINTTINQLLEDNMPKFTHANQLYDFIYVDDAIYMLSKIGLETCNKSQYYIGTSNQTHLRNYLIELAKVVNPNVELKFGEIPFNGNSLSYKEFDVNSFFDEFGTFKMKNFQEGILLTFQWIKEIKNDV